MFEPSTHSEQKAPRREERGRNEEKVGDLGSEKGNYSAQNNYNNMYQASYPSNPTFYGTNPQPAVDYSAMYSQTIPSIQPEGGLLTKLGLSGLAYGESEGIKIQDR